jgi:hypothetical protein
MVFAVRMISMSRGSGGGRAPSFICSPNPDPPGDAAAAAILLEHALETREADRQPVVLDGKEGEYVMRLIGIAPLLEETRWIEESPRLQALMNALSDHLGPWETPPWEQDESR